MKKLFRISTVPISLNVLLKGQLEYLGQHFQITAISGAGDDLNEVEAREGVQVYAIDMQRQISPVKDLISLVKLYLYFRKEKPDIVHSITPKAGLLSMLAARLAGVPHRLHTFTGLIFPYRTGFTQKLLIIMDKILCYCATNIYPEGQGVKADLENFNITKKTLKVLGNGNVNGIDVSYFNKHVLEVEKLELLKTDLKISDKDFVFVFVGRLVRDKGINELVAAFKRFSNQEGLRQSLKLLLVGPYETDLDPLLDETIREIENNPDIITVGFQKDVRPYFAISNCLVFPSYREGFPNVVLQAGALELPSIVSDINGSNEIIEDNINGIIIPVKNEDAIFDAMQKISDDRQFFIGLKEKARENIAKKFEQNILWEIITQEYFSLLDGK